MRDTCTNSKMATRQQTSLLIPKNGNRTTLQLAGVVEEEEEEESTLVHPPSPALSMVVDDSGVNLLMQQLKNG